MADQLTLVQWNILKALGRAPGNYLSELGMSLGKGYIPTDASGSEKPTLYVLRDLGLIEELEDLHRCWRLTSKGRALVATIAYEIVEVTGEEFEREKRSRR